MTKTIVCGRLDNRIHFSGSLRGKGVLHAQRIASDNPNTMRTPVYLPIATDGSKILHAGGISDVSIFFETFPTDSRERLIVLTIKEYFLLFEQAMLRDVRLSILEVDYPIMSDFKPGRSLRSNLETLRKLLKKVGDLDIRGGSFVRDQSSRHLHAIARKLRFKNELDHHFFFAYREGYQEVFRLKEERPDRVIIAFDFNSMYADCMDVEFCEPKSIRYESFVSSNADAEKLDEGIYRVILRGAKSGFFLDKHPFLYKRLGIPHRFGLALDDSVETILFKDEIIYYSKFFREVDIIEGFCSAKTVRHPLLKKARDLYAKRIRCKSRGDSVLENFYKRSLQLMHSATNQRTFKKKRFLSLDDVVTFLSAQFHLNFDEVAIPEVHKFFDTSKYFKLETRENGMELTYLDIRSDSLVFSLSARIVAAARLKLMKTMERFISDGSAEICYANVDSLHVSIPRPEAAHFLERHKDLISERLGCLKVQAFADRGYWFDVGRYWLKSNDKVVLFKNIGFNHKAARSAYITKRRVIVVRKADAFCQITARFVNLTDSFSYGKRIKLSDSACMSDYERYAFEEVEAPETANLTEAMEIIKSKQLKIELFRAISMRPVHVVGTA